ncbi:hypothetical protein ACFL2Q_20055 [Thermodesulfobacteriota bacterium]
MKLNRLTGYCGLLAIIAFIGGVALADSCEAARWRFLNSALYKFYYNTTMGKRIAITMRKHHRFSVEPYVAARKVLGGNAPSAGFWRANGRIKVFIYPNSTYNNTSGPGQYSYQYSKDWKGNINLTGQRIDLHGGRVVNEATLRGYGQVLAHETSHFIFTNVAKLYKNEAYWDNSDFYIWDSYVTESLAYYTGAVYYKYGTQYSESTIRAAILGVKISWQESGRRYLYGGWTNEDWWQFHALGWFLTNQAGGLAVIDTLVKTLYAYRYKSDPFQYAYLAAYGKQAAHDSTDTANSAYLYYDYYWYWNP